MAEQGRAVRPLVSAVLARGVCAEIPLFLCGRDRSSEGAVVFPGIGGDGYFDRRRIPPAYSTGRAVGASRRALLQLRQV